MQKELIEQIKQIINKDDSILFTLDPNLHGYEEVYITQYAYKKNTTLKDYQKAVQIKDLLLNNGYFLSFDHLQTFVDRNDIINFIFRKEKINENDKRKKKFL